VSLTARIEETEQAVQALLEGLNAEQARGRLVNGFKDALLAELEKRTLKELAALDARELTAPLAEAFLAAFGRELEAEVKARLRESVDKTLELYRRAGLNIERDVLMRDVLRAVEAAEVADMLRQSMNELNAHTVSATAEALQQSLTAGGLSLAEVAALTAEKTDLAGHHAVTQARAALSAYNQLSRNTLAQKAELKHFYYYGNLRRTSRIFCRAHAGKTYTEEQINQMRNGMLEPVKIYKGGWRCVHSLLPVDPAWDDAFKPVEAEAVELRLDKNLLRLVVSPQGAERINRQVALSAEGYREFYNAADNDAGFVALHKSWRRAFDAAGKGQRRIMRAELETGMLIMKDRKPHTVLFNAELRNLIGGDVDMVLDGNNTELYIPQKGTAARAFGDKLHKGQSDYYLFRLDYKLSDNDWHDMLKFAERYNFKYEYKIKILHNYDTPKLKDIT